MGNSLYNKIYLGRRSVAMLQTKRVQAMICAAACASAALAWLAFRALK